MLRPSVVVVVIVTTFFLVVVVRAQNSSSTSLTDNNLKNDGDDDLCRLCLHSGSTLRPDVVVSSDPPDDLNYLRRGLERDAVQTCSEWQSTFHAASITTANHQNSSQCFSMQNWLTQAGCCQGLPPIYQCQQKVWHHLFQTDDSYSPMVIPQVEWGQPLDIVVAPLISTMEIENPGVKGGSIAAVGMVQIHWVDQRLQWDPAVFGCTQVYVQASTVLSQSQIWVPQQLDLDDTLLNRLSMAIPGVSSSLSGSSTSGTALVLANGTVTWNAPLRKTMECTNLDQLVLPKLCQTKLRHVDEVDAITSSMLRFIPATVGGDEEMASLPGYVVNPERTNITVSENGELIGYLHLDPLLWGCQICAGMEGVTLRNDSIPTSQNVQGGYWTILTPGQIGWTCRELDDYLSDIPVWDITCQVGRMTFQEPCCDGLPSRKTCEESIRKYQEQELLVGSTVVPPDPSQGSISNDFQAESIVEVTVELNFEQLLGIDVQSNTLEALITLELTWTNDRLKWDPFIGQCHMTSYRASTDPEQTEIWVPELDLLNQVEGTGGLPIAHASLYEFGVMWWRRTGVVRVACELSGIRMFPFDRPSCYLDFGSARDSLVHRTFYTAAPTVRFSERIVQKSSEFQEFQVDTSHYNVTTQMVLTSGYANEVIRYQFYFERATRWYMLTFVYLYVMFTYLSFGMLLLDHQLGERLSFGASILFVMVAQDITMSNYTPIGHVTLWIDYMGLFSKCFVILGILESIIVIFTSFAFAMLDNRANEKKIQDAESMKLKREQYLGVDDGDGDNFNDEHHQPATKTKRRRSVADKVASRLAILSYRPNPNESKETQRNKYLRYVDRLMFVLFSLAYTTCVIGLFVWAARWTE